MAKNRTRSATETSVNGSGDGLSLQEVATRTGVSAATLRRWAREGLIPQHEGNGGWSPAAAGDVRIVARLRERGHSLKDIRRATEEGRLAFGYIEELFPPVDDDVYTIKQAAKETGLEPALVMDQVHQHFLQHFVEQDVVGHMETELDGDALDLGRLRVAIAFADLAGYTRLTEEEEGELEAVDAVERFVEAVETTLPDDARVIKTIGDEVLVAGSDPASLTDWAVGFQQLYDSVAEPRIGIHYGEALYRDGDYYGRDVNIASRVGARSSGGEVLVTRPVVERAGPHLKFERIAEVRLKGFSVSTEIFLARLEDDEP